MSNIWKTKNISAEHLNYLYRNGLLEYKGKVYWMYDVGIKDNGDISVTLRLPREDGSYTNKSVCINEAINTFTPNLGIVNTKLTVTMTARIPLARNYVRILSTKTLDVMPLFEQELAMLGMDATINRNDVFPQLLNPEYPRPDACLSDVAKGKYIARAFNNKYWFANSRMSKNIILGYKTSPVGKYIDKLDVIKLDKGYKHHKEQLEQVLSIGVRS